MDQYTQARTKFFDQLQGLCEAAGVEISGTIQFHDTEGFNQDYERKYDVNIYPGAMFSTILVEGAKQALCNSGFKKNGTPVWDIHGSLLG